MTDTPLNPFPSPSVLVSHFPSTLSAGVLVEWMLFGAFIIWAVYTLVAVYHWLKYSHGSAMAYPAIGTHLVVSFLLMAFALTGVLF